MKENFEMKIFLVDDDNFCLHMYAQELQNLGYNNLHLFENGSDCLNNLTNEPDVIFLDHSMTTLSGIEVLKKIKRHNPDIYVIFLSGQEAIETAVDSLKYGAFDYIVKSTKDGENMHKVLKKISEVKAMLSESRPGLLKKIFSFI